MRRALTGLVVAVMLLAGGAVAQQRRPQDIDLQAAIRTETVDGDLNGAIKQYRALVAKYASDRAVTATALVRMAECYQKLGDAESRKMYERVAREFADQAESAATARTRLAAMQSPAVPQGRQIARQIWAGNDANEYASVSPDGRYMSFMGFGVDDVGVRDLVTGTIRRLTNAASRPDDGRFVFGEYSVISRDGRHVAYMWYTPEPKDGQGQGQGQRVGELRILPLTAGEADQPRIVYRTRYLELFDWTPDGKNLLVVLELMDRTWQIAFISIADGSVRALKTLAVRARNSNQLWERPDKISLSPDGRHVAYDLPVRDGESARDIFV